MEKSSVEAIVRVLNDAPVRYLIVGRLAVVAHGSCDSPPTSTLHWIQIQLPRAGPSRLSPVSGTGDANRQRRAERPSAGSLTFSRRSDYRITTSRLNPLLVPARTRAT